MYGLLQAGIIAQELLEKRLGRHGYFQSTRILGLWKHSWQTVQFLLVVDDSGVKYVGEQHARHLIAALNNYEADADWEGKKYIGIDLKWDYTQQKIHTFVKGYTAKALNELGHLMPTCKQYSPHPHTRHSNFKTGILQGK